MNRKQRRLLKQNKERIYTIKQSDMERYEKETADAMFFIMIAVGCLTIKNHFSKLIRVNVDGKNRTQRFFDLYSQTYQDWENGVFTTADMEKFMAKYVGVVRQ